MVWVTVNQTSRPRMVKGQLKRMTRLCGRTRTWGCTRLIEYVDVRGNIIGAWFEAQVVQVQKRALSEDEPCSSSAVKTSEDDIMYHVKYDE